MRVPEMFSDQITFNTYKYAFQLFPFYSFDNDDMKSLKRHAVLLSLIFLLKSLMTVSKNNKYGAFSKKIRYPEYAKDLVYEL